MYICVMFVFFFSQNYRVCMGVLQCAQDSSISVDTIIYNFKLKQETGAVRFPNKMSGSKRSLPPWMSFSKDEEDDSRKKKHAGTSQKAQKGPDFSKLLVHTD